MFSSVLRARAGAGLAAASGVSAATTKSQALAPPASSGHSVISSNKCDDESLDGWMMADRDPTSGDVLLFRPFSGMDIAQTTDEVISMLQASHQAANHEATTSLSKKTGSGTTSPSDEDIDETIDATTLVPFKSTPLDAPSHPTPLSLRLSTLNSFSQQIASNPLIQAEMARLFLKDEGLVQELLSQGIDVDDLTRACLLKLPSTGSSSVSLLPHIAQDKGGDRGEGLDQSGGGQVTGDHQEQPIHHHLMEAIRGALDATGGACQWLGGWLRDRAAEIFPPQGIEDLDSIGEEADRGVKREGGQRILDVSLAILSIVFIVLILRRPIASFRILRGGVL